jgi:hypothetical protein
MSEKRQWDESRSPQWRYMLSKDAATRRRIEKAQQRAESNNKRKTLDEKNNDEITPPLPTT